MINVFSNVMITVSRFLKKIMFEILSRNKLSYNALLLSL